MHWNGSLRILATTNIFATASKLSLSWQKPIIATWFMSVNEITIIVICFPIL